MTEWNQYMKFIGVGLNMIYLITTQQRLFISEDIQLSTIDNLLDYFKDKTEISVDTETEGFDPYTKRLLSIQVGDYDNQFVIDCLTIDVKQIKSLLEDTSKLFLFQNFQFDGRFLLHNDIDVKNIYDTFLAECILTTGFDERDVSLKGLGIKYCNVELDKTIRGVIHKEGLSDRVVIYGALDVKYLSAIKQQQLYEIEKWNLQTILDIENKVVRVFVKMLYNGIPFNPKKWLDVAKETEKNTKDLINKLDEIIFAFGSKDLPAINSLTKYCNFYKQGNLFEEVTVERKTIINWSSNSQKLKLLSKDLGIKIESVGDRELQKIKKRHEIVPLLIEYSKQAKLNTAFGKEFLNYINPVTKRIHPSVWQILSTGRISVSDPNINQIPSQGELATRIRAAFEAPSGYKIVGGDYNGMELRIIAEFSQDPVWLEVFNRGGDLHSELCAKTFNIPLTDVKKPFPPKPTVTYRAVQKTIDFGLSYGMSEFKLSDTMQIDVKVAKELINKFFGIVPRVKQFLIMLGNLGKERGYIKTPEPLVRIRWFQNWKHAIDTENFKVLGEIERASKNTPIQGTNANIIKVAMINLQNIIDENNYPVQLIMQVYDELQYICKEEFAKKWKIILEREMIKAAQIVITSIPVEVSCKISDYWEK